MKGVLNINKPSGWTSQDVVSKVRGILSIRAIGHMGTLDPQGTGVLVLGVGKATRLFSCFLDKDKVYDAEFKFGYETDTLDKDGKIIKETNIIPSFSEAITASKSQIGKLEQIPPMYSAKSVNGERAYKIALRGGTVELKASQVEVYDIIPLNETEKNTYKFRIHCSSGTYIRSICRDLAYSLNSLATMVSINRVRCGDFKIEDSVTLEQLAVLKEKALIPLDDVLKNFERVDLDTALYTSLINGRKIEMSEKNGLFTVYCNNELFGIGKTAGGFLKIDTYLKD